MSVTLQPSSNLSFQRPLTQLVKRTLAVTNHNPQAVAYKVKTTSPRQYCVRPNSGRIESGETVEVQVLLQPMKEDPPAGAKCRDKFLVQSVVISPELEGLGLPELWQTVERADKSRAEGTASQIHEQKIRCTYLPAADSDATSAIPEETASRLGSTGPDSSFTAAPSETFSSPPPPTYASGSPSTASAPKLASPSPSSTGAAPAGDLAAKAQDAAVAAGSAAAGAAAAVGLPNLAAKIDPARSAPNGASAPVSATASASSPAATAGSSEVDRLKADLASARAEIDRLRTALDQAETSAATLRSRGVGAAAASKEGVAGEVGSAQVVEMKGAEGVPVQVVVGVAFGVFVVTWLFF
ncbi:hypothetical protein JCM10207_000041 [Rhodosporidiobolus poonsookiae]